MALWVVATVILIIAVMLFFFWSKYSPSRVMRYIANEAMNGSVCLVKNGQVILEKHSAELMPLASTVKIILLIEFSRQAANKNVSQKQNILLSYLEKYCIKNTDGNAHQSWLKKIKNHGLLDNNAV